MSTVEEIKEAISNLPDNLYTEIRKWFSEEDWKSWDSQIEKDSASGALDFLIEEAEQEQKEENLKDL